MNRDALLSIFTRGQALRNGLLLIAIVCSIASAAAPGAGPESAKTVIWSQNPKSDGSKISSEYLDEGTDWFLISEVANDFTYASDVTITKVSWWGGQYRLSDPSETIWFLIAFYDDASCKPGNLIDYDFVQPTQTPAGTDAQGFAIFRYDVALLFDVTGGETYWLSVQASSHSAPLQWGRLQATSLLGCPSMVRGDYYGYADWTACSAAAGSTWDASQEISIDTERVQACCFFTGDCTLLLAADCLDLLGTPGGDGTTCDPSPCVQPLIACCASNGACTMMTQAQCEAGSNDPQGYGSTCTPNPCEPYQACCLSWGACEYRAPTDCVSSNGVPQGVGASCSPNPCSIQACCFTNGTCGLFTIAGCATAGGAAHGPGSTCTPNPCPQPPAEACCFSDGHCEMLTPVNCASSLGGSQGTGTVCSPNPCPQQPLLACCFTNGSCSVLTQSACDAASGYGREAGTTCAPNLCPVVIPVSKTSWGEVKILYR
jgi:hypothetical protein